MKRIIVLCLAVLMAIFTLTSCGSESEAFKLKIICESDDIYMIYYSCYIDDEYYGMGGMSDYDQNEITSETELEPIFTKSYLENREDVSSFSIDFSPYGQNDTSEIGTTNRVYIDAKYGEIYTIIFSGDRENGYTAELQQ